MKVAIIGAGIYGCHLGTILSDFGIDVKIYEKESEIFNKASGNNQFRLHWGFHYARDYRTRQQSKIGFSKFMDHYKDFTEEIAENLYVVPKYNSLIDFRTYLAIFSHEGFSFDLLKPDDIPFLKNIDGVINVDERVICVDQMRKSFKHKLKDKILLNKNIDNASFENLKQTNDYVIDCTWGKLEPLLESFYEVTHLAYCKYKGKTKHPALTFVDGNLWSLYPTEKKDVFTLSHVKYTPIFQSNEINEVNDFVTALDEEALKENYLKMLMDVRFYYEDFEKNFEYIDNQVSVKTKIVGSNDPRDCRVWKEDNVIRVFSGKIDTLYIAEEFVLNEIL